MTSRLDAQQLDQAWDASVLGMRSRIAVEDPVDLKLLELLANAERPTPNPAFLRAMDRQLGLEQDSNTTAVVRSAAAAQVPRYRARPPVEWRHPRSRWITTGYALAALALVLLVLTFAIVRQRSGEDDGRSIPAASDWLGVGTPISRVQETTLFSKTLTPEEMALYESDQWQWTSITKGTMAPGDQAIIVTGSPVAGDVGFTGLGAIAVTSGTLEANAAEGATVQRGDTGIVEPVDRSANVILDTGDTLIVPANTLPAVWNTGDADATYITGGVYTQSNDTPLNEMDFDFTRGGIQVDPNDLAIGTPVTMSLIKVAIPPGASHSYVVTSETWLEGIVGGGPLRQVKRIDGTPQGKSKTLVESTYSFHSDGFGEYTLTNEGTATVEVSFFRVEAHVSVEATPSP